MGAVFTVLYFLFAIYDYMQARFPDSRLRRVARAAFPDSFGIE